MNKKIDILEERKMIHEINTNKNIIDYNMDPLYKVPRKNQIVLIKRFRSNVRNIEIVASKNEHIKFSEPANNPQISIELLQKVQTALENYTTKELSEYLANTFIPDRNFLWNTNQTVKVR